MAGETNLRRLLAEAQPVLDPAQYVFITTRIDLSLAHPAVIGFFREAEGVTLIAERAWAERERLDFIFPCRRITLTIHSSREAVGLMAAVSGARGSKHQHQSSFSVLPRPLVCAGRPRSARNDDIRSSRGRSCQRYRGDECPLWALTRPPGLATACGRKLAACHHSLQEAVKALFLVHLDSLP